MRGNPEIFIQTILRGDPWSKQIEIARSVYQHHRTAVRSCHGVGKTKAAAWIGLWFLYCFYNSKVITTAPTWHQVENLLWREIRSEHERKKDFLGGKLLTTSLELSTEWFALGLSTNKPERFQGFHAEDILLIVDEASGVDQEIFEAAEGFMTSVNARMLLIGNPTRVEGEFYQAFKGNFYNKIHISAFDSPNLQAGEIVRPYLITPEWVEDKKIKWGEDSPLYKVKVLGEFPDQGDDALFRLSWVESAFARFHDMPDDGMPREVGVDVARFGPDKSVIGVRLGDKAFIHKKINGQDTWQIAEAAIEAKKIYDCSVIKVDEIGVGSGVVDTIRHLGHRVIGCNGARKATGVTPEGIPAEEFFINKRAQWYWQLRERFSSGRIGLKFDDGLEFQLPSLKYEFDKSEKIRIQEKEKIKKELGQSPDEADMLEILFSEHEGPAAICEVEPVDYFDSGEF